MFYILFIAYTSILGVNQMLPLNKKIENRNLKKQKSLIQNGYYKSNYSRHNIMAIDNFFFIFIFVNGKISLQQNQFGKGEKWLMS